MGSSNTALLKNTSVDGNCLPWVGNVLPHIGKYLPNRGKEKAYGGPPHAQGGYAKAPTTLALTASRNPNTSSRILNPRIAKVVSHKYQYHESN